MRYKSESLEIYVPVRSPVILKQGTADIERRKCLPNYNTNLSTTNSDRVKLLGNKSEIRAKNLFFPDSRLET